MQFRFVRSPATLGLTLAATLGSVAFADTVTLTNGKTLEGEVRRKGDSVIVKTPHGEVTLESSEVKSVVEGATVFDEYLERRKQCDAESADAQCELAAWCKDKSLRGEARRHYRAALEIDTDHARAREALGYTKHDEQWMTEDEVKQAEGFVKIDDKWVPREEARRRQSSADVQREKRAMQNHVRKIQLAVAYMSSHKRKTRAKGRVQLQEYAESINDLDLAAFASRVADYYNTQWRIYKTSLAKTEIRATVATLKRPIPTIQTSLGAFSTPVTMQLPELSVVSIKTTAMVPATEIELDDE
jgi:hypothetical protein